MVLTGARVFVVVVVSKRAEEQRRFLRGCPLAELAVRISRTGAEFPARVPVTKTLMLITVF